MTAQHSPLPWRVGKSNLTKNCVYAKDLVAICQYDNKEANAQFIVQACNSFYTNQEIIKELLEACKQAVYQLEREYKYDDNLLPSKKVIKFVKAAIAKVERKE